MPQIVTNGYGNLIVNNITGKVGNGPDKVVSVHTGNDPADLTRWETYQLIDQLVTLSGLGGLINEVTGEITILKPESPAVKKRKEELAMEYFKLAPFGGLRADEQRVIEHIISLEKKLGELE